MVMGSGAAGRRQRAVLGLRLIGDDVQPQAAIRRELDRALTPAPKAGRRRPHSALA